MTSRDFCFWLQGFLELNAEGNEQTNLDQRPRLNARQVECVKRHLELVFTHEIDPSMGDTKVQAALNAIHLPPAPPGGPTMRC